MTEQVLVALFSVAVGPLLGGVVNATVGRYASFKGSQAVAAALRVEIEVLLGVIVRRNRSTREGDFCASRGKKGIAPSNRRR